MIKSGHSLCRSGTLLFNAVIFAAVILAACSQGTSPGTPKKPLPEPEPITLEHQEFTIEKSASREIQVSRAGEPLDPDLLDWTVSDTAVADVDSFGLVTARASGTALLSITLKAEPTVTTSAVLTVTDTTAPRFGTLTAPAAINDNQALSINIGVTDPGDGPVTVELYNGSTLLTRLSAGANNVYSCSYRGLPSATYNALSIKATDADGNTAVKNLSSLRVKSTDSALRSITVGTSSLNPSFNPGTLDYTVRVRSGTNLNITASKRSSTASSTSSSSGTNPITARITVTAEAGSPYVTVYTIKVISY